MSAGEAILQWGDKPDFSMHGAPTANDRGLAHIMWSLRWSNQVASQQKTITEQGAYTSGTTGVVHTVADAVPKITVSLADLDATGNQKYRLQLLFKEQCCSRGFNIKVNGAELIHGFAPERNQGGVKSPSAAAIVTWDFTSMQRTLEIELDGAGSSCSTDANWQGGGNTLQVMAPACHRISARGAVTPPHLVSWRLYRIVSHRISSHDATTSRHRIPRTCRPAASRTTTRS